MSERQHLVLAVVDCSGSMSGQAAAITGVQLHDLLNELQSGENTEGIRFGVLGYQSDAFWMLSPMPVAEIEDLPVIQIRPDRQGFFPVGSLSAAWNMLADLLQSSTLFPAGTDGMLHIVLFTDGFPTELMSALRSSLDLFCASAPVANGCCNRYLIQEPSRLRKDKMRFREAPLLHFLGDKRHLIPADGFAAWLNGFAAELKSGEAAASKMQDDVFSLFRSMENSLELF